MSHGSLNVVASRNEAMKFHITSNPGYQLESDDGKIKLDRTVRDAGPAKAFYSVAWAGRARGTVLCDEQRPSTPDKVKLVVHLDFGALERSMQSCSESFQLDDVEELQKLLAQAICELHRLREGPLATRLGWHFDAVLHLPDGELVHYRDGALITPT